MVTPPLERGLSNIPSGKRTRCMRVKRTQSKKSIPVLPINTFQTLLILWEKIPREKRNIHRAIIPMVIMSERLSVQYSFPCARSGNIFQDSRCKEVMISCMKRTGTTESAPASIPIANLRDPRGELSRYENTYPQIRMGRKVMMTIGMSDNTSIE